ncbi:hypothetical protein [Levilactobacillus spicheri]|uniref:S-layer protein n=2 Tax=Levilactobacillus spicheri TaxID=216463 RepID=A0ABQ0WQW4_9LACO|nr:hypothetical protein [Levilactobacillus spicheri]KRL47061.1 hypothetical protein FD37_GL000544 [Levilactobacillus spicheri DSM 15429]GEO67025.1 hypothetical protein LSP04_14440 [Levilactobacillus spicheri]
MQSRLAKSLYLGLAALSFGAVATVSTTASAKSKAKVVSTQNLKTDATTRNVEVTGTNAIYSKPGTVKGARIVASKSKVKTLAASKKSADYFRAYAVAKTNKGSVYYKIVSMNGKYRGYIYGGKSATTFAGGIQSANTMTDAALPANTTAYFAKPGTANVTWNAPKYTQYKASKQVKNTTPFAKDTLKITKAATKTREGSLYYYVEDATNPSVSGWIYSGAVTATQDTFDAKTDVKVQFKTTDGTLVKETTLAGLKADSDSKLSTATGTAVGKDVKTKATNDWGKALLSGTGYTYAAGDSVNVAAVSAAKTGDTITLFVTKNTNADTKISFYGVSSDLSQQGTPLTVYTTDKTADATTVAFPKLSASFTGANDAAYTANDLQSYLAANGLTTLDTPSYTDKSGAKVYTEYTFSSALAGNYSTTKNAKAFYTSTVKTGTSPVDTPKEATTTANTNYVG